MQLPELHTWQDVPRFYDWLNDMRENHPVFRDPDVDCWHVFRYEDVNRVITDYELFSSERQRSRLLQTIPSPPSLISMDPPQHKRYRNLVSPSFTPRALSHISERIRHIVQDLLDQVRPVGRMDFVADFAYPLPTIVIAEMLGVPTADRPLFKGWADTLLTGQLNARDITHMDEATRTRVLETRAAMTAYFRQQMAEHRRHPGNALLDNLMQAEVEGEKLSEEEIISFSTLLLIAGHITTIMLLGQSIICLAEHPEVLERLRTHPSLIPTLIEEVLRYYSPVWRLLRITTQEVTIGGQTIPENALIFAWLASANRDERQFPQANQFIADRSPNHHIAFGHGIHFCLGAPLARLEASIALPMIVEQLPELCCVSDEMLELLDSRLLMGVKRLPVTFRPSIPVQENQVLSSCK
jgi:cytochrome P450